MRVFSYVFQGYWEDIGTIRAFFEANLDLTAELPRFNFFDMSAPIFSRPRFLPAPRSTAPRSTTPSSPTAASSTAATITHSIVGLRCIVGVGQPPAPHGPAWAATTTNRSSPSRSNEKPGTPAHRHRRATAASRTPSSTRTPASATTCVISPAGKPENVDHPLYYIRDGIVIIPKNGVIPHGTVI